MFSQTTASMKFLVKQRIKLAATRTTKKWRNISMYHMILLIFLIIIENRSEMFYYIYILTALNLIVLNPLRLKLKSKAMSISDVGSYFNNTFTYLPF
jgi:hypothetical protein